MGTQVNARVASFIVYDTRGLSEADVVYESAVKITNDIMEGIERLALSDTIKTATLFIHGSGAQLILLVHAFDEELIAPEFESTLKSVTYDSETGYIQRHVIPILDIDSSMNSP
nr:MAG: hypothetical protein AM325_01625 [Candidatus Thorarchaeota archaeon SMTZ1-45]